MPETPAIRIILRHLSLPAIVAARYFVECFAELAVFHILLRYDARRQAEMLPYQRRDIARAQAVALVNIYADL